MKFDIISSRISFDWLERDKWHRWHHRRHPFLSVTQHTGQSLIGHFEYFRFCSAQFLPFRTLKQFVVCYTFQGGFHQTRSGALVTEHQNPQHIPSSQLKTQQNFTIFFEGVQLITFSSHQQLLGKCKQFRCSRVNVTEQLLECFGFHVFDVHSFAPSIFQRSRYQHGGQDGAGRCNDTQMSAEFDSFDDELNLCPSQRDRVLRSLKQWPSVKRAGLILNEQRESFTRRMKPSGWGNDIIRPFGRSPQIIFFFHLPHLTSVTSCHPLRPVSIAFPCQFLIFNLI